MPNRNKGTGIPTDRKTQTRALAGIATLPLSILNHQFFVPGIK